MGLLPNHKSHERGCWICPLDCLHVPAAHPQKEEFHEALLTFANKGSHPIYVNLPFFELSPNKIHAIKSIKTTENLTEHIIRILHNISINHLPYEVEMFVRNCDTTKHQYTQCTLIGSSDCLTSSSGTPTINLDNPDEDCLLRHVPHQSISLPVHITASNSFGFGGSNLCLILKEAA